MNEMTRPVVVLDSYAGQPCPRYRQTFKHATFESIEHPDLAGTAAHPHGAMVASCYLSNFTHPVRVVFLRILDTNGRGGAPDAWWLDQLRQIAPRTLVCSWGASDGDSQASEMFLRAAYGPEWQAEFDAVLRDIDCDAFFAAGNSDKNDSDPDVDFPQAGRTSPARIHILGACDYRGTPAAFSGDAAGGVDAMFLGVRRAVMDPTTGAWQSANGTSFACPDGAGDAEARGLRGEAVLSYYRDHARFPASMAGQRPHPKAGWGSMVHSTQDNLQRTGIHPAEGGARILSDEPTWHDFTRIG